MIKVTILNANGFREFVRKIEGGANQVGKSSVIVGSKEPYAYGIETGRHRGGRLARRAGVVFYMQRALEVVRPQIGPRVTKAIVSGPGAVDRELQALGKSVENYARQFVVVKSGRLRGSLHTRWG